MPWPQFCRPFPYRRRVPRDTDPIIVEARKRSLEKDHCIALGLRSVPFLSFHSAPIRPPCSTQSSAASHSVEQSFASPPLSTSGSPVPSKSSRGRVGAGVDALRQGAAVNGLGAEEDAGASIWGGGRGGGVVELRQAAVGAVAGWCIHVSFSSPPPKNRSRTHTKEFGEIRWRGNL